jgi:hypothetical protein
MSNFSLRKADTSVLLELPVLGAMVVARHGTDHLYESDSPANSDSGASTESSPHPATWAESQACLMGQRMVCRCSSLDTGTGTGTSPRVRGRNLFHINSFSRIEIVGRAYE